MCTSRAASDRAVFYRGTKMTHVFELVANYRGGISRGLYASMEAANRAAAEFLAPHFIREGYNGKPTAENWGWHLARLHGRFRRKNWHADRVVNVGITPRKVLQ